MRSFHQNINISQLLFIFTFLGYLLITGGNFWEYDSNSVYELTKSIVNNQSFEVSCYWGIPNDQGICFSRYGLFMSIAIIPLYLLEKIAVEILKLPIFYPSLIPSLTNAFITSLLVVLFFKFLSQLNFSKRLSCVISVIFAFSTYLVSYTKTLFAEPLLTLLIFACLYSLLFFKNNYYKFIVAGELLGLAFLTKISAIIILPTLIYIFWQKKYQLKNALFFLLPFIICVGIFCFYNFMRYGGPFITGYQEMKFDKSILEGLYIFFLSPGKSLIFYQPVLLFAIPGFIEIYRINKQLFAWIMIFIISHLIFYGLFTFQAGDHAWGSRYLYYTLPVIFIAIAYTYQSIRSKTILTIFWIVVLFSFAIQFSTAYLSWHRYYSFLKIQIGHTFLEIAYFDPRFSPLYGQMKLIFNLDHQPNQELAFKEAFQEGGWYKSDYQLAQPDLLLFRSKTFLPIIVIIVVIEILIARRLMEMSKLNNQLVRK